MIDGEKANLGWNIVVMATYFRKEKHQKRNEFTC
jgi:hypothetical protein